MVLICDKPYQNNDFQPHFDLYPFPLSDFQKYAIQAIVEGNHTLVTAHTGSGKTLPAEFAIHHFNQKQKKIIYTSPIKALSNQKFHDFSLKFPHISFGLFTGDIKTNPDADVLIMTTEILMNYLFNLNQQTEQPQLQFEMDIHNDLACVVFDEVHYINDKDRGQVWEKTIMLLPPHIQMVMLSATIDNPQGFATWCENIHTNSNKTVYLSSTDHRVVPLTHYAFMTHTESIFKYVTDKVIQKQIKDNTNRLILLKDHNGNFNETGYNTVIKMQKLFQSNNQFMKRKHVLNQLASFLKNKDMLPAIAFIFSRKLVESCALDITTPLLEFDSKIPYTVEKECEQIIRKLPNYHEYMQLPEYKTLVFLLQKGIGIHHSGMIPILREIVELMISKKYIKLLFATESFAIGLDCPIKTAIFTNITKFDGTSERFLHSHEYTQMAGRAGRRGIDKLGYVVHCNNLFHTPSKTGYLNILSNKPQKLISKFYISYSLILNYLKNNPSANIFNISSFCQKSMITDSIAISKNNIINEIQNKQNEKNTPYIFKTPEDTMKTYIEQLFTLDSPSSNQKKKQKTQKLINSLLLENKYLENDYKQIQKTQTLSKQITSLEEDLASYDYFFQTNIQTIIDILSDDGFIQQEDDNKYSLTEDGIMGSHIAEVHPIILCRLIKHWDYFSEFNYLQMIGLFSCFTDIKLHSDDKTFEPSSEDSFLNNKIYELLQLYEGYNDLEHAKQIQTGIKYDDALQYDIIDLTKQWCLCENETDCRIFIEKDLYEWNISIGDFTKAMLKIVTITKELINVFETIPTLTNHLDTLEKLKMIEPSVLKYVMTSQSLYV